MSNTVESDKSRSGRDGQACLILMERVTKRYGQRVILDEIDLSVREGETVALIGPSGGGKSTLLRAINALHPIDAGRIRVGEHELPSDGQPVGRAARMAVRRLAGMIFQDFQLFPHLSALDNVAEAPTRVLRLNRAQALRRAAELLERVGMSQRAAAYPDQLSGGQKQRVAIARALAMEPRALLCDEITSALDPELKHEVLEVLARLKQEGMTLVLVTHEIGFARRAADRVVVLADGKIIEEGPPEEVLERPSVPRTQQFLRNVMA
ncbi:MAG TPA: amino acid ABC transporter ATP-binding protein [Pirellulales bacterium]|jgi:ABC-type polar amino acid transport system ATPase subunit|nr:amino acid ABC transporter ATP-binding protein [Pirellulales bacterium]